jgi:hypothetical protein
VLIAKHTTLRAWYMCYYLLYSFTLKLHETLILFWAPGFNNGALHYGWQLPLPRPAMFLGLPAADLCRRNTKELIENVKVGNEMSCLQLGLSILLLASKSITTNYGSEVQYVDLYSKFRFILSLVSTHTTNSLLGAAYPTHITRISSFVNFSNRDIHYLN